MSQFPVELQRVFERALMAGHYQAGDVLTLRRLSERFQAEPTDVAAVMAAETRKGLVQELGPGEFQVQGIARPEVGSVFVHAQTRGLRPTSEVRAVVKEPASETVAQKLRLEIGAPVYRFERTRRVREEPLANQVNYIPFEVCPDLEHDDVSHTSFQKLLEEKYLVFPAGVEERLAVVPAEPEDRAVLGLPAGGSVLRVERLARSSSGWPVVWAVLHVHPDRYQYVAKLWPAAAELLRRSWTEETNSSSTKRG